jgi:hypothetical protein
MPIDAISCPTLGSILSGPAPGPLDPAPSSPTVGRSHFKRNALLVIIVALAVAAAALWLLGGGLFQAPHTEVVASGYAVIPEGYYTDTAFSVPAGATHALVSGSFTASGDSDNQITVLIMSQANFQNWEQGIHVEVYYDSGQVSGASVSVALPPGSEYAVVYDNTFTGAASTVISGQLTLSYDG